LLANGQKIGEGRVEKTTEIKHSLYEGQDIGLPVDFSHTPSFTFTGTLHKATVELK
jgi:hypothetical protein